MLILSPCLFICTVSTNNIFYSRPVLLNLSSLVTPFPKRTPLWPSVTQFLKHHLSSHVRGRGKWEKTKPVNIDSIMSFASRCRMVDKCTLHFTSGVAWIGSVHYGQLCVSILALPLSTAILLCCPLLYIRIFFFFYICDE